MTGAPVAVVTGFTHLIAQDHTEDKGKALV